MLPRKNLHAANGCFSALRIIYRQILFKFLTLIMSASQNFYPKRAHTFPSELLQRIDCFLVIGGYIICN